MYCTPMFIHVTCKQCRIVPSTNTPGQLSFAFLSADTTTTTHDVMLVVRPKDRIVVAGSSVELYCIPRSNASIQWFKDGVRIEGVTVIGVLQIHEATVDDTANYTCTASNDHTSDVASATITVIGKMFNLSVNLVRCFLV